jgi:hypothetical protein
MAPATLTLRDNFTRSNAALTTPYLNNAVLGSTIPRVISNQCGATAVGGFVRNDALGADQGVRFTYAVFGSDVSAVWLRGTGVDLDNATTQSLLVYIDVDYLGLWKFTKAGGYVAITEPAFPAAPIASGSVVQVEVAGNIVTIWDDGVVWATLVGANAIASGSQVGIEFDATDTRIDDLYTGSIASPMTRSGTDAATVSDASGRLVARVRATTDASTASDAPGRFVGRARATADAAAASESASRSRAAVRATTDAANISDTAARSVARTRSVSDVGLVAEAAVRSLLGARGASETVSVTETSSTTPTITRSATDAGSVSETTSRSRVASRAAFESVAVNESAARASGRARSASETTSLAEATARLLVRYLTAVDGLALVDVATQASTSGLIRIAADTVFLSDVTVRAVSRTRPAADAVTAAEAAARATATTGAAADSLSLTDIAARATGRLGFASESLTLGDGGSVVMEFPSWGPRLSMPFKAAISWREHRVTLGSSATSTFVPAPTFRVELADVQALAELGAERDG